MFDFVTTQEPPVPITINKKQYTIGLVRLPELGQWATEMRKKQIEEATAHIKDDQDKARMLIYFPPVGVDVVQLVQDAVTPQGVEYFIRRQLGLARVPQEDIEGILKAGNPLKLRKLVDKLVQVADIVGQEGGTDRTQEGTPQPPLQGQTTTSGVSAETGAKTTPGSEQSTTPIQAV